MLEKTLTARIQLTFKLADDLWPVYLDSNDLEDTILNISINAMYAMEGNGELTFSTSNDHLNSIEAQILQLDAGDYVSLNIVDTGCGMDEKTKEEIFEPFFTTKGEAGTGLGLSQVYGFVQRSGGAINVHSELGHGTHFTIYFPRYLLSDSNADATEENIDADIKGKETILVVDDEPALLQLTTEILRSNDYNVLNALNGKQALKILGEESVDLLLSDVIMPGMDGYQLSTIVQEKYPAIKIQLVSGYSDNHHKDIADDKLNENLLNKPYSSKVLLQKVRALLE